MSDETTEPRTKLSREAEVTARFYPSALTLGPERKFNKLEMSVAYQNGANKEWASSTPSGRVELNLGDNAACDWFQDALEQGDDIHVTFTRHNKGE